MENYIEELKKLLTTAGFTGRETKIPYEFMYQHIKTIVLEDMNHQSDLKITIGININHDTPSKENSKISINISLHNNNETLSMPVKNCIEYIKEQFKYELRKAKVDKILNEDVSIFQ